MGRKSRRRKHRSQRLAWLAALACLGASACHRDPAPARAQNAILITLDTTRADALGCYGGQPDLTPALDRLAAEGIRFTNARTVAPLTLPAHASMLTGLYPPRHSLRDNGLRALPQAASTLAERCREAGMQTAAFVSAVVLDRAFGLDQGFEVYDQPARPRQQTEGHFGERPAGETVAAALAWFAARDPERPFFLWVHLYDPHVPYRPPAEFLQRAKGDPYRGEIAYADREIGRLLEALRASGVLKESVVVVTADHGESLGEHGEPTHGAYCYDATLRVPLIVREPHHSSGSSRARAGEVDERLASVVDIAPTLLGALHLPGTPADLLDGVRLDDPRATERGLYCESYSGYLNYGWSPLAGWVTRQGKYLHSSKPEYYALATDPREGANAIAQHAAEVAAAQRALLELASRPALVPDGCLEEPTDSLRRDLKSLGYAALGSEVDELPRPLDSSDRPSPAERAQELEPLLIANALGDARRWEDAIVPLEKIVRENPRHALALDLLAFDLMQLGRWGEAQRLLEQRIALGLRRADTHLNLGTCQERLGHPELACPQFRRALELDPENVQALEALLRVCAAGAGGEQVERWRKRLEGIQR
jgi:choline-sulfatase